MGAEIGAAVTLGVGWAVAAGAGMEDGDGTDSAAGTWEGAVVGTGVTAGSGMLSACIAMICSAGEVHPLNRKSDAAMIRDKYFMLYPFSVMYIF